MSQASRSKHPGRALNSSVLKCIAVVEAFIDGPREQSLTELGRTVGQPLTTVHRMLATLEQAGWVERGTGGGYLLSLRLAGIALQALSGIGVRDRARDAMRELSAVTGETSYLVVRDGDRAVCVERVESATLVRVMSMDIGTVLPLWIGAAPLALLAFLPASERERLVSHGPFEQPAGSRLTARLAAIRENGYVISSEEATPGIASIGAPVFDRAGLVTAGLSVGGLAGAMTGPRRAVLIDAVRAAAASISSGMGHRPAQPG